MTRHARVFRFAPSPNGYLHLGHAYSALLNHDLARALEGRLDLRIDDIDATRCRPHYETAIYEDLAWLGISWNEPVRRQSEHLDDYRAAIGKLEAKELLYASFESRSEINALVAERERRGFWPHDPDGVPLYPGHTPTMPADEDERRQHTGEPFALRLAMETAIEAARKAAMQSVSRAGSLTWSESGHGPQGETGLVAAAPQQWGDVVLARKELPASYHLATVVDDAAEGVTDIVRGQDLFWSTSIHRLLQALLGLPEPNYRHHRLILGEDGRKLSKSTQATSLRQLRAAGASAAEIRRMVGLGH
ncbi:MAG: tRNA glutamyl-Q(34) synthetase GluQRS [Xanthobacteraceae bacterium]